MTDNTDINTVPEQKNAISIKSNSLLLCNNCGAELNGKFCHECGQSSRSMIKFFGEVVKEVLDDVIGYDSRLKHSIMPLLFQPGKLTKEYIQGRRFYYVMPFRLYLFTSILFIIILQFTTNGANFLPEELQQNKTKSVSTTLPSNQNKTKNKVNSAIMTPSKYDITSKSVMESPTIQQTSKTKSENKKNTGLQNDGFYFRLNKYGLNKPQTSPKFINISTDNPTLNLIMDEINSKAESWKKDPSPLINEFFNLFPYMMFIILPIFAIFSKFFYLFSKRFYVEHLIFSLHNHSFIYLVMIIEISLEAMQSHIRSATFTGASMLYDMTELINTLIILWIMAYIFIATKRFYQQGWIMTISKTIALGLIYLLLISVGLLLTLIIGAYLA